MEVLDFLLQNNAQFEQLKNTTLKILVTARSFAHSELTNVSWMFAPYSCDHVHGWVLRRSGAPPVGVDRGARPT